MSRDSMIANGGGRHARKIMHSVRVMPARGQRLRKTVSADGREPRPSWRQTRAAAASPARPELAQAAGAGITKKSSGNTAAPSGNSRVSRQLGLGSPRGNAAEVPVNCGVNHTGLAK
jgi:hypothetical protein